ncbi:hypothetical protein [Mycobacterium leprae]|nr:hypothetical protein [Mycobacterium leprae]
MNELVLDADAHEWVRNLAVVNSAAHTGGALLPGRRPGRIVLLRSRR